MVLTNNLNGIILLYNEYYKVISYERKDKKYLKDLIEDVSIEVNTIEFIVEDIQKSISKLKKIIIKLSPKLIK